MLQNAATSEIARDLCTVDDVLVCKDVCCFGESIWCRVWMYYNLDDESITYMCRNDSVFQHYEQQIAANNLKEFVLIKVW